MNDRRTGARRVVDGTRYRHPYRLNWRGQPGPETGDPLMMKHLRRARLFAGALVTLVTVATAATAPATWAAGGVRASLYAYPGYAVQWSKGVGLADPTGKGQFGLVLEKVAPTVTDQSGAGLTFSGVSQASELAFDIADVTTCGTAPMFRIVATDGTKTDLSCQSGLLTPRADGWTHVSFDPTVNGYAGINVSNLFLRIALPLGTTGRIVVDNVDVNGTVFGK